VNVSLMLDVHVHRSIMLTLRLRGVDVLTAQEDGSHQLADLELLRRATQLGRVLVTYDDDLLAIASQFIQTGERFTGVIYASQRRIVIGRLADSLEVLCLAGLPSDFENRMTFL